MSFRARVRVRVKVRVRVRVRHADEDLERAAWPFSRLERAGLTCCQLHADKASERARRVAQLDEQLA